LLPMAAGVVPEALAIGIRRAHFGGAAAWPVVVAMAIGAGVAFTVRGFGRFVISAALAGGALLWFQFTAFPAIDGAASARPYWLAHHPDCAPRVSRSLLYGLEYYAGRQLAPCSIDRTRSPLYGTERR
jgi:hypothetical protein